MNDLVSQYKELMRDRNNAVEDNSKLKQERDELAAMVAVLSQQLKRVIGDHTAPNDCYYTGPYLGDMRDYSCPSCEGLRILASITGQAALHEIRARALCGVWDSGKPLQIDSYATGKPQVGMPILRNDRVCIEITDGYSAFKGELPLPDGWAAAERAKGEN